MKTPKRKTSCRKCKHCLELVKKAVKDKYRIEDERLSWTIFDNEDSVVAFFEKGYHPTAKSAAVCDSGVTKGGAA